MKNLTKLWGTLVTLLIVGAASWYGLDPSAHDTSQNQVSENTKITDSSIGHRSSALPTKSRLKTRGNQQWASRIRSCHFYQQRAKGYVRRLDQLRSA